MMNKCYKMPKLTVYEELPLVLDGALAVGQLHVLCPARQELVGVGLCRDEDNRRCRHVAVGAQLKQKGGKY